jgi:hypothetical protein
MLSKSALEMASGKEDFHFKEPSMPDSPTHKKFPEDSANRDYDVFEELPDGSTIWRACVFGMGNVELKLRELAKETSNKLFALNLQDQTMPVIHPSNARANQQSRRAG